MIIRTVPYMRMATVFKLATANVGHLNSIEFVLVCSSERVIHSFQVFPATHFLIKVTMENVLRSSSSYPHILRMHSKNRTCGKKPTTSERPTLVAVVTEVLKFSWKPVSIQINVTCSLSLIIIKTQYYNTFRIIRTLTE